MPQNAEAAAFIARIAQLPTGPGVSLNDVLKPSVDDEAELRKLFAQDKSNTRLKDPYVGLVDVFDAPADIRTTRARVVANDEDLNSKYIMPLSAERRREEGAPAMVDSLDSFRKNWSIFTEGSLSQLTDWSNVIAAGGSVQACLNPVPQAAQASKRALRKYFHNRAFPTSDVDLFLYGLTPEQAEVKINAIYEAVRDSVPWDVTCIRTKHTVSIHSQYPYRAVQIVLRLYQSPAEVLAGFDVDAPCCAYDGERVYANPRAIVAMMRQCNTVDVTRRSPSYEVRLSKYSLRDFEVYVPQLNRADIDPTIYERSIVRIQGLARLLVLEKLATTVDRENYLQSRRRIRGRPTPRDAWRRILKKKYKGDLKTDVDSLDMSNYDVVSLHIPYGPGWDARRIEKLVYQTDLGMNSPFNPKNKGRVLHRHAAFFGTMPECLEDCCEHCPVPRNEEEKALQEEEDKSYIRGRVEFIVEDPGRQSISGSFNPIDEGEWSEQAYLGQTEKFFKAIAAHDRAAVAAAIKDGIDVNRRDHVGRTPLQVAILCKAVDIACDLVDADARMTARIVDGRTALHLAAQLDLPQIIRKMLDRSALNDEEAKAAAEREAEEKARKKEKKEDDMDEDKDGNDKDNENEDEEMRDSSDDDWSSDDEGKKNDKKADAADEGVIPEGEEDEPDVFLIDTLDWDYSLSPLDYAIASGSLSVVEQLLAAGANPKLVTRSKNTDVNYVHPLILTGASEDDDIASQTASKLIAAGAVTSEADENLYTILHRSILTSRPRLVSALLKADPNAKAVLNIPWMDSWSTTIFPITSAVNTGCYAILAVLLAYGAKVVITRDEFQRARELKMKNNNGAPVKFLSSTTMPLEVALINYDEVAHLLVALGAEFNLPTKDSLRYGDDKENHYTCLDYTQALISKFEDIKRSPASDAGRGAPVEAPADASAPAWKLALLQMANKAAELWKERNKDTPTGRSSQFDLSANNDEIADYFKRMEQLLVSHNAKSATAIFRTRITRDGLLKQIKDRTYLHQNHSYNYNDTYQLRPPFAFYRHGVVEGSGMHADLAARYEELYAACWSGNNAKIQRLCLPQPGQKVQQTPLQISVQWGSQWKGYTPLFVAILNRRWDTAKLIITIAAAQYSSEETSEDKNRSNMMNLIVDSDDDDGEDEDEDEDQDMEPQEQDISLVDVAKIPPQIHTKTPPSHMLNSVQAPFVGRDGKDHEEIPIIQAIVNDDFEAFVQLLDLYNSLPTKNIPLTVLGTLILYDRPAMLDEFIRRTGLGINLEKEDQVTRNVKSSQDTSEDTDNSRVYLGLTVHGKKRKDLASKADGLYRCTSYIDNEALPMLWQAARQGSMGIVRYLASEQPLAAYRFYATSHGDVRAKTLRRFPDLAAIMPEKLGWKPSALNETVVSCAIYANKLNVLEALSTIRPIDIEDALHLKHSHGFNNIMLTARWGCQPTMFDYLLSKGLSPLDTDGNGWNMFHMLCAGNTAAQTALIKHALEHLPKDIIDRMFRQQAKETHDTPLHVAVKANRPDLVELLIQAGVSQFLVRDCHGSAPLHVAVKDSHPQITKLLAQAGPAEALTLEDGVGNTPVETATRKAFLEKLHVVCGNFKQPLQLRPNQSKRPFDVEKQEKELPLLRATIDDLLREGRLTKGTKLTKELIAFADHLETRLESEKDAEKQRKDKEKKAAPEETYTVPRDGQSTSDVLKALLEELSARPVLRQLVHVSDVHESVKKSLVVFEESREKAMMRKEAEVEEGDIPEDKKEIPSTFLSFNYKDSFNSLAQGVSY